VSLTCYPDSKYLHYNSAHDDSKSGRPELKVTNHTVKRTRGSNPSSTRKRTKLAKETSTIVPADVICDENDKFFHQRFRTLLAPRPPRFLADSICSFPTALVNCLNSCDNNNLTNLMRGSLNDDCAIGIHCFASRVSLQAFLKFIDTLDIVHPDRVYNIHNTSVVNDRITASTTLKFTDCKMLYDLVSKTTTDPDLTTLFSSRADHLKRRLCNYDQSETDREQMAQLVASDADLLVTGTLTFQISFDENTKKATGFYVAGGLNSAYPVPSNV